MVLWSRRNCFVLRHRMQKYLGVEGYDVCDFQMVSKNCIYGEGKRWREMEYKYKMLTIGKLVNTGVHCTIISTFL